MISTAARLAIRNLGRNRRRTILSVLGIGVGVGLAVLLTGWMRGMSSLMMRAAAESGSGHLRIAPAGWLATRDDSLRLEQWEAQLARARALPDVAVATPRVRAEGLLGMGNRISGVEFTGVDPLEEPRLDRLVRKITRGRYLEPGERGSVVLGAAVAKHLGADLDDDLVATAASQHGEIGSQMLRVVGIVDTGTPETDALICHVSFGDVEDLSGAPGAAEITLLLRDPARLAAVESEVRSLVPPGTEVHDWEVLSPDVARDRELHAGQRVIIMTVVVLLVVLGVASAQLTATLERRREFAVLLALGMRGVSVARQLFGEALALGLLGAVAALAISFPILYRLATVGINLGWMFGPGGEFAFGNALIDPVFHAELGLWMIPMALALSVAATTLATLYPIWFATRTDPADALRTAQ